MEIKELNHKLIEEINKQNEMIKKLAEEVHL